MPRFLPLLMLGLGLLPAACSTAPEPPDTAYRSALEEALETRQCAGPTVDAVWKTYNQWFAVASVIPHYYRGSEASALLLQAEAFRSLGCDAVARASYEELLRRFADEEAFAPQRVQALRGLDSLAPPFPLTAPTTQGVSRPAQPPNSAATTRVVSEASVLG